MDSQGEGRPIFVDDLTMNLTESEQLEVIFAHLMCDFDEVVQNGDTLKEFCMIKQHIENMRSYLLESHQGEKAMAEMIEMVKKGRVEAIRLKKQQKTRPKMRDEVAIDSRIAYKRKLPDAPYIEWYDGKPS